MLVKQVTLLISVSLIALSLQAADVVPPEIQQPGTQPNEVGNFESPDKCDNCHSGYNLEDPGAEPATGWRGAAMGNAGRDAIFWATLAVAEQDFDGVGDLCIRCHSAKGWYGGRSTPTDGSGLAASDDNGIDCDTCHATTNPDNSGVNPSTGGQLLGVMNSPFTPNCSGDPLATDISPLLTGACQSSTEGYYGSGMLSLYPNVNVKLGPYGDAEARHQWEHSAWHRDVNFCGSCHDVSNSAVGDLAQNHGKQLGAPDVVSSGDVVGDCVDENGNVIDGLNDLANGKADLRSFGSGCMGSNVEVKAAFNNPPYAYGVVERTFSEYKASAFPITRVGAYPDLPADLKVADGSLGVTYNAAIQAATEAVDNGGIPGDYADGTKRFFSCQSCHMRPVVDAAGVGSPGCNKKGVPLRKDLPRHDHTGGNYWFASITKYQDDAGTLRVGGGLNGTQLLALDLGQERATKHLSEAGSLKVTGDTLRVTNLTGHKLITGYPEGRRMWLNIKWYKDAVQVAEDGKYGTLQTGMDLDGDGNADSVETLLDLDGANTKIYEAHYAITRDWADIVQALHGDTFVLSYDRLSGDVICTVGDFLLDDTDTNKKEACKGDYHNTFHFALNNYVSHDNRIPPYRMSYDEAQRRSALPVPADQYGNPGVGGIYNYWDEIDLGVRAAALGATSAEIKLLYQGTSWEYNQFLLLANNRENEFLGQEGVNMMDAWLNAEVINSQGVPITGVMQVDGDYKMVPPVVMATANWNAPGNNNHPVANDDSYSTAQNTTLNVVNPGVLGNDSDSDDGDTITATQDASPNGSLTLNTDGSFTYIPSTGFTGTDSFTYHAVDSNGAYSDTATVTINVTPPVVCSVYDGDRAACKANGCSYSGKTKTCQ